MHVASVSASCQAAHSVQSRGIGYQLSSKDYNSSSRASCSTRVSCTASMYWQGASGRHLGAGSREGDNSSPPPPQALHSPLVLPVPAQQAISFFQTQVLSSVPFTVSPAATELTWLTRQPETIANTDNDPPVAPHGPYRKPSCASGEFEQDANAYTRLLGQRRRLDKSSYPVVLHILWFSFPVRPASTHLFTTSPNEQRLQNAFQTPGSPFYLAPGERGPSEPHNWPEHDPETSFSEQHTETYAGEGVAGGRVDVGVSSPEGGIKSADPQRSSTSQPSLAGQIPPQSTNHSSSSQLGWPHNLPHYTTSRLQGSAYANKHGFDPKSMVEWPVAWGEQDQFR